MTFLRGKQIEDYSGEELKGNLSYKSSTASWNGETALKPNE